MSDNPSLYIRVKLSQSAFENYLDSNAAVASDFGDWITWFDEKEGWYDPLPNQTAVNTWSQEKFRHEKVKEGIKSWCPVQELLVKSIYDGTTGVWQFGCVDFSYNTDTILPILPFLRNVCQFKDTQDSDYLLIYDFLNEPDHRFGIFTIEQGKSKLCHEVPEGFITEASAFLSSLLKYDD